MFHRRAASVIAISAILIGGFGSVAHAVPDKDQTGPVEVSAAVAADVSAPVRDLTGAAPTASTDKAK